jgi:hypothetical protein
MAAAPVGAHAPTPVAAVTGTVTDGKRPLAEATVELFGTKLARVTGPDGAFRFDSLKPGPYWFKVRRIGFAPITFATTLRADDTRDLQVPLDAAPYQLSDLEVQGGMTKWRYNEFRWRKAGAWGKFYTRDDIAEIRPYDLIALVQRGLPQLSRYQLEATSWEAPPFYDGGAGFAASWQSDGSSFRACAPAISFNGATPWPGRSLTDFQLEDIEAVEVYGGRHIPLEFGNNQTGGCGLVVVWLR